MGADLTNGMHAVVFDFFGTLTPVSPPDAWAANVARMAAAMRVSPAALLAVLDETFGDRISGALGGVRETVQALASRLGVPLTEAELTELASVRREVQESTFALRPEALQVIRALRERNLKIGLVSDCTSELPDAWDGLPVAPVVDTPVFSCLEGTRKPDPRLFRKVAAGLSVDPSRCLYVGDGGGNELAGSSDVGMRAVLLAGPDWFQNGTREHWRREINWAGRRIESLTELCS